MISSAATRQMSDAVGLRFEHSVQSGRNSRVARLAGEMWSALDRVAETAWIARIARELPLQFACALAGTGAAQLA